MTEQIPTSERMKPYSLVRLHILRHAEKAGANNTPAEADLRMPLTPEGKRQAIEVGKEKGMRRPLASGGPSLRAHETALFAAAAHNPNVKGTETFDELLQTLDEDGLPYESRSWTNKHLDFPFKKGTTYHQMLDDAYEKGIYLKTLVKLDDEAKATGERGGSTYALQARNIAQIIERYTRIATKIKEREDTKEPLERFLGTHGATGESFLLEVLLRTKGKEERDKFLESYPNGFDYAEGFDAEILSNGTIHLSLPEKEGKRGFDVVISSQIVGDIVRELPSARV